MFNKITTGFVVQEYDDKGYCIGQHFVAGDIVDYEDSEGNSVDDREAKGGYQPFDMIQPDAQNDDEDKEGYLLLYRDVNILHIDFITKDHYARISKAIDCKTNKQQRNVTFNAYAIDRWRIDEYCRDSWPYNNMKILGAVSVPSR